MGLVPGAARVSNPPMVWRRLAVVLLSVLGCLGLPAAASAQSAAPTAGPDARYALANGCFALRSSSAGKVVAKSGGGYAATSPQVPGEIGRASCRERV